MQATRTLRAELIKTVPSVSLLAVQEKVGKFMQLLGKWFEKFGVSNLLLLCAVLVLLKSGMLYFGIGVMLFVAHKFSLHNGAKLTFKKYLSCLPEEPIRLVLFGFFIVIFAAKLVALI